MARTTPEFGLEGEPRARVICHKKDGMVDKSPDLDLGYVSNFRDYMVLCGLKLLIVRAHPTRVNALQQFLAIPVGFHGKFSNVLLMSTI
jgi:hypothetical protein